MAPRDADRTLPLPTSALFDPTLPMLAAHALSLRVPAAEVPGASGAGASGGVGKFTGSAPCEIAKSAAGPTDPPPPCRWVGAGAKAAEPRF